MKHVISANCVVHIVTLQNCIMWMLQSASHSMLRLFSPCEAGT